MTAHQGCWSAFSPCGNSAYQSLAWFTCLCVALIIFCCMGAKSPRHFTCTRQYGVVILYWVAGPCSPVAGGNIFNQALFFTMLWRNLLWYVCVWRWIYFFPRENLFLLPRCHRSLPAHQRSIYIIIYFPDFLPSACGSHSGRASCNNFFLARWSIFSVINFYSASTVERSGWPEFYLGLPSSPLVVWEFICWLSVEPGGI